MALYSWHFEVIGQYSQAFLNGFMVTVQLSILIIVFATLLGILFGVLRSNTKNKVFKFLIEGLIELLRAMPILVLIVWLFYAFPIISGIQLPAFETAVIALSLVSSGFIAEIIRSGIDAIPKGQIESAKILGFNKTQIMTEIVLPQALMKNIPPILGEYSTIIKNTTLVMIIGVNELLYATSNAAILSYRPMELYTFTGLLFLGIIIPLSLVSKKFEFKHLIGKSTGKK